MSGRKFLTPVVFVAIALALGGCAKNNSGADDDSLDPALAGVGHGSAAEFASASVGDRVFFNTDQTDLSDAARAILDRQASWLNRYSRYHFMVEGHADERGTREYNFALGSRRADTVKTYLISKGVDGERIRTISYGKERPAATCNDVTCWSQNRRAVTVLNGSPTN